MQAEILREKKESEFLTFSIHFSRPSDGKSFEELEPRNFSFNSPYGACVSCDGLGTRFEVDPQLVIPNPDLCLEEGAITPWSTGRSKYFQLLLRAVAEENMISMETPWKKLSKKSKNTILEGIG